MSKYIKLYDAIMAMDEWFSEPITPTKILSELPTIEVSEDCISREWVLAEFEKGREMIYKSEYFDELVWLVIHAPSVVPSRAEGEWIEIDDGHVLCKCSICNEEYLLYEEHVLGRNYCPNCGADMRGEK